MDSVLFTQPCNFFDGGIRKILSIQFSDVIISALQTEFDAPASCARHCFNHFLIHQIKTG